MQRDRPSYEQTLSLKSTAVAASVPGRTRPAERGDHVTVNFEAVQKSRLGANPITAVAPGLQEYLCDGGGAAVPIQCSLFTWVLERCLEEATMRKGGRQEADQRSTRVEMRTVLRDADRQGLTYCRQTTVSSRVSTRFVSTRRPDRPVTDSVRGAARRRRRRQTPDRQSSTENSEVRRSVAGTATDRRTRGAGEDGVAGSGRL
ncbi:hypothetical protein OH76DRAFT_280683 [Lentinus brumalis]|uniref:Uncharacterized protein n=1 Tax=Lentinus brumalis TaxID=2498619 RepID=A0A371CKZ0_9APHY|nr:hypothetical protein OH76DRAFT_280683 [Polyporus brumalis]